MGPVTNARVFIRLVIVDVTKDSSTCLACVYLNEYKIAVAAFTLHGSENKLVRVRNSDAVVDISLRFRQI